MTPLQEVDPTVLQLDDVEAPKCNILIADDEPANLIALEAILEPLNQNVIRATSGVDALRQALRTEFCVVLLDVQMPEMDGLETATLLRRRSRTRDVPIIFLTAVSTDESWVARGYDVGAVDYLVKPYDPDALRTKVATFVELGRKNALIRAQHEALRVGSQQQLADLKRSSERRYEDLANSMPQVVWTADASGRITYHNQRWAELAEARDGEGSIEFASLAHADDLAAFSSGWASAVRAGTPWEAELRLGTAARGYRFHLVRAVPRHDERGRVVAWIGTATDIDARVRADRALRLLADASDRLNGSLDAPCDLEVVLRMALPLLGDAAILDVHAEPAGDREIVRVAVTQANRRVLEDPRFSLGPSTVGYSGRPEIVLDVAAERVAAQRHRDGSRESDHLRFLGELGVRGYLCVPLPTRARTIGTISFVRFAAGPFEPADAELASDLARRMALAIDNAWLHATTGRRREELEQANRSKDVFLATLSHELRTPLNVIVGWTDMVKRGTGSVEELRRAMETIERNAHALSGLVADLLDVSRIVTNTLKIESEVVSLRAIVESAVVAARLQSEQKKVALELAIDEEVGCVRGDAGRLRQVINNIISNGIKFTPEGGSVKVSVARARPADDVPVDDAATSGAGHIRVLVTDTGVGIAPEFLPHAFERFRQEERGGAKGLGLGLAIVKHLVEEHGGRVWVNSDGPGTGTRVGFELPVAAGSIGELEQSSRPVPSGESDLAGVHVLLVEDDPDGNELVSEILSRSGARVTSTFVAEDALDALRGDDVPDLLVSDIGLPDMSGIELIEKIRGLSGRVATIPAIALTAYASRQDATRARAAGFDAHVAKPVQPTLLAEVVGRLLRQQVPASQRKRTSPSAA